VPYETIAAAALLVACTYCVFGMTGFGSTVLAIPILVYLMPLKFAVTLLLLLDLVASILLSARARRGVRLDELKVLVPFVLVGIALGLTLLIGLAALFGWALRRARPLAIGLAWTAVGLLPVANLATPTGVLLAERTLLLPSVGVALGFGWVVLTAAARVRTPVGRLAVRGVLLLLLGLGGWRFLTRNGVWHDQARFFASLERDAPGSYRAQLTAGIYYKGVRRMADAERAMQRAWSLYRDDPAVFEEYGQLYRIQGRCDRGLAIFAEGVERHPDETVVRARLIECALALGDTTRARQVAREAVQRGRTEFEGTLKRLGQ